MRLNSQGRKDVYKEAEAAENISSNGIVAVLSQQDLALDAIVKASNSGWPEWTKYIGFTTKSKAVRDAMYLQVQDRIQQNCPELAKVGWFKKLISPSTRKAIWTAESEGFKAIAMETKDMIANQDKEVAALWSRYSSKQKMFAEGGVRVTIANTKAQSKLLQSIEGAAKRAENEYEGYAEKVLPPEVKLALNNEELLVDDLVNRYEVIEPHEVDRLFQDNQNGGKLLQQHIDTYFTGALYKGKASEGARLLASMSVTGREKAVEKIRETLGGSLQTMRYSFFRNQHVWYYRSLMRIKEPNSSPEAMRRFLQDKKPVAGTRLTFDSPQTGQLVAFTKVRQGDTCFRLKDTAGNVYVIDIGSNDEEREKMWLVKKNPAGGPPDDIQFNWRDLKISAS